MFVNQNINPQNLRVGDCVIRAIAEAEGISWDKAYIDLCIYGLMYADLPISNNVWGRFLYDREYEYIALPNLCPFCYTIRQFCDDHPEGTYVLGTGTHAICVKNGDYYDSWDSGDEVPIYAFKKMED